MEYSAEELLVLVKELADIHTSKESTSITYEAAQKLMNAVLYCIRENDLQSFDDEKQAGKLSKTTSFSSAREAYDKGYRLVLEKIKAAREIYNEIIIEFNDYGNRAYYDTVVKGIPEFFTWYDPRLNPMNYIILLDYNVLERLDGLEGVDLIYRYMSCIRLEQSFLKRIPEEYVRELLKQAYQDYEDLIINISGSILKKLLANMLIGTRLEKIKYDEADYEKLTAVISKYNDELEKRLEYLLEELIYKLYQGDKVLYKYLVNALSDIAAELKNAARNKSLNNIM